MSSFCSLQYPQCYLFYELFFVLFLVPPCEVIKLTENSRLIYNQISHITLHKHVRLFKQTTFLMPGVFALTHVFLMP